MFKINQNIYMDTWKKLIKKIDRVLNLKDTHLIENRNYSQFLSQALW